MSAISLVYLYCDGGKNCPRDDDGAQGPFKVDPLPGEGAREQRAQAKLAGWIRAESKDYCPACRKVCGRYR